MDDLLDEFIAETRDMLEILSSQLVLWEQTPEDRALLDSVFRFVHTVKGSCGFLELPRLQRLSHAAEDLLSGARDGRVLASAELVTAVLLVIDRIAALTNALVTGKSIYDDDNMLIEAMLSHLPETADVKILDLADNLAASSVLRGLESEKEPGHDFRRGQSRSVRVSLALLDTLMNGVSDLVLARNEVSRHIRHSGVENTLDQAFTRLSSSVAEMHTNIGQMRMQNIDRLFSALPRILRDIACELDKKIELIVEGSEVEVDRDMVETLRDPLLHILRNAADHGIENKDERRNAGKDPVGCIRILAHQSGNQIVIEISDDGRGIDLEKIRGKAIAAKLVTAAEWSMLPEKSQLAMIFMPGLSTADQITAISGRGVGMDVVHTNVKAVGGAIELENNPGHGLKMTLRMPLTLSIIAGLSVKAGDQLFGIPRSAVVEILSRKNSNVQLESIGSNMAATIRGKTMPYVHLETLLEIEQNPETQENTARTLVVIKPVTGATYVLDVANVIDHEELVVKPAAPLIMASGLYAGTSLPDNGRPVLLLDTSGIATAVGIDVSTRVLADRDINKVKDHGPAAPSIPALLFLCVDGEKRAIRLSAIDKMEDVPAENIRFLGGKMRVQNESGLFDAFGINVVRPECALTMLRVTDGDRFVYLAVEDVLDIFSITGEITPSACPAQHEGVVFALGEPVELLNVFQYFEDQPSVEGQNSKALCYVECAGEGTWERTILGPLLLASGYSVSFDADDLGSAAVVLSRATDEKTRVEAPQIKDNFRQLKLRSSNQTNSDQPDSIYCYDRVGLISAIETKLAGAR
jgi:two-component system, chemotaxis family, sensor kinase CheA